MKEYHKIVTVYERDPATNFKTLIMGNWAKPEFKFLADVMWFCEEKIDGTNIRIMWDGEKVRFGGKTDAAQLYVPLLEVLQKKFYAGALSEIFGSASFCLYGEGYGAKIQKGGGNYIPDGVDFILFDVLHGDTWLERKNVLDIANRLEVKMPSVMACTLRQSIDQVQKGIRSELYDGPAEGFVMRPLVELRDRLGHRVITKLKNKDFK